MGQDSTSIRPVNLRPAGPAVIVHWPQLDPVQLVADLAAEVAEQMNAAELFALADRLRAFAPDDAEYVALLDLVDGARCHVAEGVAELAFCLGLTFASHGARGYRPWLDAALRQAFGENAPRVTWEG